MKILCWCLNEAVIEIHDSLGDYHLPPDLAATKNPTSLKTKSHEVLKVKKKVVTRYPLPKLLMCLLPAQAFGLFWPKNKKNMFY